MNHNVRRERRSGRLKTLQKGSPLNLVSLMDIFTILVFFLLVNSSSETTLPNKKDLSLPVSKAKKVPRETLIIAITSQSLLIDGKEVVSVAQLLGSVDDVVSPLKKELQFRAANRSRINGADSDQAGYPITIMGDESIPYEVMHKVLATCQSVNYTDISFAAHRQARPAS